MDTPMIEHLFADDLPESEQCGCSCNIYLECVEYRDCLYPALLKAAEALLERHDTSTHPTEEFAALRCEVKRAKMPR